MLLADGTTKPIEEVQPGDTVVATEPKSGKSVSQQVFFTIRTDHDKSYVDVTVRNEDGSTSTITATDNHPFWSVTAGRWVDAGELRAGDLLRTAAGTFVQITAVRAYTASQRTFDLTINGTNTYYALAGSTPLLVHNCGGSVADHSKKCKCAEGEKPRIPNNKHGGRGSPATQAQNEDIQKMMQDANPGWTHKAGGTKREQRVVDPATGKYRRPDLWFIREDGSNFFIQTVTTKADGLTPIADEVAAAADIGLWGNGPVIMIAKIR